jgi:xylose dehydrogenase (NAD/NADP)
MPVRWGLLSTASIGATVVDANRDSPFTTFAAVASRDGGRARAFAAEHGIELAFGSYEELLASDEIEAVYVALPVSLDALRESASTGLPVKPQSIGPNSKRVTP